MANDNSSSGGVGIFTVLLILFIALKLLKVDPVAHWSWWWVLSPLWIPLGLIALVFVLFVIGLGIYKLAKGDS